MTFRAFLKSKLDEDSVVGDLARDSIFISKGVNGRKTVSGWKGRTIEDFIIYLSINAACSDAYFALSEAFVEYVDYIRGTGKSEAFLEYVDYIRVPGESEDYDGVCELMGCVNFKGVG